MHIMSCNGLPLMGFPLPDPMCSELCAWMEFPVDTLESVHHGQLELSGQVYMDELLHGNPDHAHYFLLPSGRKVQISLSSVGFVPLYGANLEHKILALFAPEDPLTAVALLLSDQWYAVENILRTANPTREGLFQVRSVVDRVILYVLNRIVYRTSEMAAGDVPFLCHDKNDYAKILWHGGEAVGFYSIKTKGSWSQFCLPVMNSIFVRKGHRGNGHGLRMLEDFVDSFKEDALGLKYPLSPAMSQVCQRYLARYPADVELLWEVEGLGRSYQKTLLANRLSALALAGVLHSLEEVYQKKHPPQGAHPPNWTWTNELQARVSLTSSPNGRSLISISLDVQGTNLLACNSNSSSFKRIIDAGSETGVKGLIGASLGGPTVASASASSTGERPSSAPPTLPKTEKANAVNKHLTFAEEGDDRPISTRTRSSEHRWRKRGREELAEGVAEPQPKKMNRGEELWPETMEPPTAVISAAEHEGVEDAEKSPPAGGMGEASVTCEAMDQEAKDLVMEVNGSGSEEEEESMAEKAEEEAAPSLQNGMVREEEEEMEEECIEDPAAVNSVDKLKEAAREKQEEEDKRGKGKDSAPEDKQEDETPAAVEGEQRQEVTSASEDVDVVEDTEEDEGLWASLEEEEEEEPSVSDEKQEGGHGAEEIKPGQSEAPPSSPEGEITETSSLEEATGTPLKGEPGPKAPENEEHSSVGPGGVMDTSDHPSEDEEQKADEQDEVSKEKRVEQKEERREATEKTDGMAEDEAGGEADRNAGARDVRVHRGGRSKAAHLGPKHASRKLGKATAQAVEELDEVVAEDEEGGVSTEEEAEHSLEEEGQREVIDMRVLRGKTKVFQATPQHRAKRRSKMLIGFPCPAGAAAFGWLMEVCGWGGCRGRGGGGGGLWVGEQAPHQLVECDWSDELTNSRPGNRDGGGGACERSEKEMVPAGFEPPSVSEPHPPLSHGAEPALQDTVRTPSGHRFVPQSRH
ncbi:hypothetical protein P4O66_004110 [Electrophorus voltai]|uniref:Family with sequence similarity 169 member Aa n=1 Tax=Electrophorus voltai TaxID=2609070 RepID=A0AAD9E3R8_9TELE|nr:hypothetical protein P4O66_004110 [Electrophorus voltai]